MFSSAGFAAVTAASTGFAASPGLGASAGLPASAALGGSTATGALATSAGFGTSAAFGASAGFAGSAGFTIGAGTSGFLASAGAGFVACACFCRSVPAWLFNSASFFRSLRFFSRSTMRLLASLSALSRATRSSSSVAMRPCKGLPLASFAASVRETSSLSLPVAAGTLSSTLGAILPVTDCLAP